MYSLCKVQCFSFKKVLAVFFFHPHLSEGLFGNQARIFKDLLSRTLFLKVWFLQVALFLVADFLHFNFMSSVSHVRPFSESPVKYDFLFIFPFSSPGAYKDMVLLKRKLYSFTFFSFLLHLISKIKVIVLILLMHSYIFCLYMDANYSLSSLCHGQSSLGCRLEQFCHLLINAEP